MLFILCIYDEKMVFLVYNNNGWLKYICIFIIKCYQINILLKEVYHETNDNKNISQLENEPKNPNLF